MWNLEFLKRGLSSLLLVYLVDQSISQSNIIDISGNDRYAKGCERDGEMEREREMEREMESM